MNIKEKFLVEKNNKYLFNKLIDFANFKNIMPENLSKFGFNKEGFEFTLDGLPSIEVVLLEKKEYEKISFISSPKSSVKFKIDFLFEFIEDNKTNCEILFSSDTNPFVKMMLEKPLSKLINVFSNKMINI